MEDLRRHSETSSEGTATTQDSVQRYGLAHILGWNLRVLATAQAIAKLSTLAVIVVLARYLEEDDFGRYTVAVALVSVVAATADLGAGTYVAREGAQSPEQLTTIVSRVIGLRLIMGMIGIGVAGCVGLVLNYDAPTLLAVFFLTIGLGVRSIASALLAALQALERLGEVAVIQIREALAGAGAILVAVLLGAGVIGVAVATGAAATLSPLWAYRRLRRAVGAAIRPQIAGLLSMVRLVSPFAASAIFTTGLTYLDSVMVHAFKGNAQTALYGAAYRLFMALEIFPAIYFNAVLRSATYVAHSDRQALDRLYAASLLHVSVVAAPLVVAGVCLPRPILQTVYGEAYGDAATAFALLVASAAFTFPAWVIIMVSYSLGRERVWALIMGLSLAGNGTANVFAIPRWGIEGAAAVTLATMAAATITGGLALNREGVRADIRRVVGKPLLAGLAMTGLVLLLRELPLAVPLVVGGVAYIGMLGALRTFQSGDWQLVRAMLAGKARPEANGAS